MSKIGMKGKIEENFVKKIQDLGNMSKIGKKYQDCVTDLKQRGCNMSKIGKKTETSRGGNKSKICKRGKIEFYFNLTTWVI